MSEPRLSERLQEIPIADEEATEERAWQVVRAAYAERPAPRPRPTMRRLALAVAGSLAVLAIALSPAGAEVVDVVRDVVGIDDSETLPALESLPAAGELLIDSDSGPWIVREDGSKRLLGDYGEATWSPRGLFVAAADGRQLVAVDPLGEVRWTVTAQAEVHDPRWSPSGFRIAYLSGDELHVVAGDGTGDHVVARDVEPVAPAWRPVPAAKLAPAPGAPGSEQVSFVDAEGRPRLVDADTGDEIPEMPRSVDPGDRGPIREIGWSVDGTRVVTLSPTMLITDGVPGGGFFAYAATRKARFRDLAISPVGNGLAVVEGGAGQSEVRLFTLSTDPRLHAGPLFAGPGSLTDLTWSPDGRWLLTGWPEADQWLFIRSDRPRRLVAIDDISAQFDPGGNDAGFPRVEGWVLPQR